MIHFDWTPERIEQLFALIAEGKSMTEVAAILGVSRNACIGKYQRERVKRGHIPEPRKRVLARNASPPKAVGFILPPMPPAPRKGPAVGLLDVTGCKWAIAEDSSLIGGKAFCNHPRKEGSPYCEYHAYIGINHDVKPIPKSLGAYGLRFGKVAA